MNARLTVRHFFLGYDVALGRTWEFHDHLAARSDIIYHLHVIGRYSGPRKDLDERTYVERGWPFSRGWFTPEVSENEVWIIRGWNHPLITLASILARWMNIPTLLWSERPGLTYEASSLKQAARVRLRKLLLPVLFVPYRKNTIVLGTGSAAVEEFQRLSHGSPGRVFPYPNPIADAILAKEKPNVKNDSQPLLLFVSSLTRRKGVDQLADVCDALWSNGYRFRMRYVGVGPLWSLLKQRAESGEGRTELYPFAGRTILMKHYQEADAVLLPSRHDGWGLTIHEGLASGVPVIASDACGAADLIVQSGCGQVIKAGDRKALAEAIAWVTSLTPHQRKIIREKGLDVARRMTIPRLADILFSYCREALELRS